MKKYWVFIILLSLVLVSCTDAPSVPEIDEPDLTEPVASLTTISIEEAVEKGLPMLDASHYFDKIYPSGSVTVTLPADGSEVLLQLNTMAHLGTVVYYNENSKRATKSAAPQTKSDGYYVWCSDPMHFIFVPYEIEVMDFLTISYREPDCIAFRYNPETKNKFYKYWNFYIGVSRVSPFQTLETREDIERDYKSPRLTINIKVAE